MLFGIIGWAVVGLIVGFAATKMVNLRGDDPILSIGVSTLGGIIGGVLFSMISGSDVGRFNVWSLLCSLVAAIVAVVIWHVVRNRSPYETPTSRRSY